jgi:3-phenylpropionate/cinnamic acid dioxygenase small subunit
MRAAFLMGLWQAPRGKTVHIVSNLEIATSADGQSATCLSNFIITRTGEMEQSKLHACGRYYDSFENIGGVWLFKSREAVVDTNILPAEFTELL